MQRICPDQLDLDITTLIHRRDLETKLAVAVSRKSLMYKSPNFHGGYHFSGNSNYMPATVGNGMGMHRTLNMGEEDQTLEILMCNLDPEKCKLYFAAHHAACEASLEVR